MNHFLINNYSMSEKTTTSLLRCKLYSGQNEQNFDKAELPLVKDGILSNPTAKQSRPQITKK